jgi:FAD/FMN-containing dehydrogenase
VAEITARAITPVAVEMLDGEMLRMVEEATHAGYPMDAAAVLLIELEGLTEAVEEQTEQIREGVRALRGARVPRGEDGEERDLLWKGRKNAFGAVGRVSPSYYVQDGVVPRTQIAPTLRYIARWRRSTARHQQYLPRGRRQHAPDHPVQFARSGRTGAGAGGGRRHSALLHFGGRVDHRRARRGHGEERADGSKLFSPIRWITSGRLKRCSIRKRGG